MNWERPKPQTHKPESSTSLAYLQLRLNAYKTLLKLQEAKGTKYLLLAPDWSIVGAESTLAGIISKHFDRMQGCRLVTTEVVAADLVASTKIVECICSSDIQPHHAEILFTVIPKKEAAYLESKVRAEDRADGSPEESTPLDDSEDTGSTSP